jgi:hypothetical protein
LLFSISLFLSILPFFASSFPPASIPNWYSIPHSYRRLHSLHRMSTALLPGNQQAFFGVQLVARP